MIINNSNGDPLAWAEAHQIQLIGTKQSLNDLYYDGFDPAKVVDASQVNGFSEAMEALMSLPDCVVAAMEPQYNEWSKKTETKAIYFSTQPLGGWTWDTPYGYSAENWIGVYPGFILGQATAGMGVRAVHEFGHVVDKMGLRVSYYWQPIPAWSGLKTEVDRIFDAQGTLWEAYANKSKEEDFAVHFHAYVWYGEAFYEATLSNPDLRERYSFLKNYIFQGTEYVLIIRPAIVGGQVSDTVTSEPIAGAYIYFNGELKVTTDQMGYFEVSVLAGTYEVRCEKGGYDTGSLSVSVVAGQNYSIGFALLPSAPPPVTYTCPYCGAKFSTVEELNAHVASEHPNNPPPTTAVVDVYITESKTGKPIIGAEIYCASQLVAVSDQTGYCEFEISPGTYTVRCGKEGYAPLSLSLVVEAGGSYHIGFGLRGISKVPAWVLPVVILGGIGIYLIIS
jgi:hypothetical protein